MGHIVSVSVDKAGRLVIPKEMRQKLGLDRGGLVELKLGKSGLALKPVSYERSAAKAIARMHLPVAPWEEIEGEIEEWLDFAGCMKGFAFNESRHEASKFLFKEHR
jgi:AbrB family looped-hinge helix DNA binding protein